MRIETGLLSRIMSRTSDPKHIIDLYWMSVSQVHNSLYAKIQAEDTLFA
jgi:hypothetical protein